MILRWCTVRLRGRLKGNICTVSVDEDAREEGKEQRRTGSRENLVEGVPAEPAENL